MQLPLADLALLVLADFQAGGGWNQRNWMLGAKQLHQSHKDATQTSEVMNRLAEAWAWLNSRAYVSWRPDQDSQDSRRVTEEGQLALDLGLARLHAAERLEGKLLPELEKARRQFLQGDYEEAVFASFRRVEESVRALAQLDDADLGVKLMRRAFKTNDGPLADPSTEAGEQDAMSNLFAGAIGAFKNPSSHRSVAYNDPALASEAVLLADLLLRLLDRRSKNLGSGREAEAEGSDD